MRRMQLLTGSVLLITLAAIRPSPATAAVQETTLSVERAAPGTSVSIRIETSARWEGTQPGTLYLVPQPGFDTGPLSRTCDQVRGSIALGEVAWRAETVEISSWTGQGFVGEMTFTVPQTAAGDYYVAETSPAINARCHMFAGFGVALASLPDTALPPADERDREQKSWRARQDSNLRPSAPEADALSTELQAHV